MSFVLRAVHKQPNTGEILAAQRDVRAWIPLVDIVTIISGR
jgi:hypothetical protein